MAIIPTDLQSTVAAFSADLQQKVTEWLQWDKNEKTRQSILDLIKDNNVARLSELLLQRQAFGTAGIRALMEPGFNGLNDLVIIQTSQGLAKYLVELQQKVVNGGDGGSKPQRSVVIGFDGRYNSLRFAKISARAFIHCGYKVYLFSRVVPTPFVPFSVRHFSASAGVMVTASHNPKMYNGYKVYLDNGAQILSPHDRNIQAHILQSQAPWGDFMWDTDSLTYESSKQWLVDPVEEVMERYMSTLVGNATQAPLVAATDLHAVYTALHGVGHECLTEAFKRLGFRHYFPVLTQKDPDPEFPTVVFPNPEEGQGVLDESIRTATESNSTLIIANDPDSDRLAASELHGTEWRVFNGNELGALLGWWIWSQFEERNKGAVPKSDVFMTSSAVSSKILETIAKREGFTWFETLTGFKWMGNYAVDLHVKGKTVLFAFEEAIGFMVGTQVFDKDGITGAATLLQLAAYLRSKGSTLLDQLNEIYRTYGFHYSINSYFICHDPAKIERIFNRVADLNGPNSYISEVNGIKVVRVRDLNRGYDSSTTDKKPTLPTSTSSFMLTLYFANGSVITFRTSGTEPKIKYYSEMVADPSQKDWNQVKESHRSLVEAAVEAVLEPKKNEIQPKKD